MSIVVVPVRREIAWEDFGSEDELFNFMTITMTLFSCKDAVVPSHPITTTQLFDFGWLYLHIHARYNTHTRPLDISDTTQHRIIFIFCLFYMNFGLGWLCAGQS
jgi:hypothetical protein